MDNLTWLQLSDLHIFNSTDWNIMRDSYRKLAELIAPNFIVITGDFRHKRKNNSFEDALKFLNEIVTIFGLEKKDIFLVPGNHDVNDYRFRREIINTINSNIEANADVYLEYMLEDESTLMNSFKEYIAFVRSFYGHEVDDDRVKNPAGVINVLWEKKVNIVMLNTALISSGDESEYEIIDINQFSKIEIDDSIPTLVLAHHSIDCLATSHKNRAISILNRINARVYMCGDEHKLGKSSIEKYSVPNTTIPVIVCGKSSVEMADNYSDLSVIEYKCSDDGKAYVQVYQYTDIGFIEANNFYYNVNKRYSFPMRDSKNRQKANAHTKPTNKSLSRKNSIRQTNRFPVSIWLPDAELAQGKQTRFNSFTTTDIINKFFDDDAGYLGIASVKGIGKTFILQVKRVKSTRKFYCLPDCSRPSAQNNWATECVSFSTYSELRTDDTYNNLVILWNAAIKCYIINNIKNDEDKKIIKEYCEKEKITADVVSLCMDEFNSSLDSILKNAINIDVWYTVLANCNIHLSNLCKKILYRRKQDNPAAKSIAIFIDKVDQSIKQTNAEPPAV